jgi:hypothetical protein
MTQGAYVDLNTNQKKDAADQFGIMVSQGYDIYGKQIRKATFVDPEKNVRRTY